MTTTARKAPVRPATKAAASKSGNPATRAAAAKAKADQEAELAAAKLRADAAFAAFELPPLVLDEDGYEVIPDKSKLEGGTYRFKVGEHAYTLPNLQYLPVGIATHLGSANEAAALNVMFERYAPGLLENISGDQLIHVIKRWKEYSVGVGLGE